jgi:serine/threonine-protein kinase
VPDPDRVGDQLENVMNEPIEVEDRRLTDVVTAAADGIDLDWGEASATLSDPGDLDLIRELKVVAALTKAGRTHRAGDPFATSPSTGGQPNAIAATSRAEQVPDSSTSWGPLRIIGEVGRGSFGRVFRAWEPRLARDVALKLLDAVPAGTEGAVAAEARLLAQIRHDNIVTVFGADHFDSVVGFWMEFVEGRTLKAMHHDYGSFSAAEGLLVALDVCRALAAVHRAGFVHGDVKPQNIMREAGGRIVLTDFGAARLVTPTANDQRRTTVTPFYAAPEILLGAPPSVQSDLYSLGVVLYYLVTGQFPVTGKSIDDFCAAHASGRRTLLRDVRPDLPPSFIRVVDALTAALPEDRPESAGALDGLIERAAGRVSTTPPRSRDAGRIDVTAEPSIAVLPFADMSADHGLAYFCEGLAEEIIHALGRIPGLRVVPRTSAFTVDAGASSAQHIGSMLNVRTVLQGGVRASGTQLRVTARLTDAVTGVQLWSEQFTRELTDIFGVQDEIASAVCGQLGVRLRAEPRDASAVKAVSPGADAYTLYLQGRYCWNQRTELALQKSAAYFHAAIEKEPEYAPAHAALAETYTTLGLYGVLAPHDIMPRARSAARRAIEIAGDLASAHATAACVAAVYEWQWRTAALGYHRAIEVNPDDPSSHHWYAINYLVPLRRFEDAAAELRRAAEADPLSMAIRASFGIRSYFAHDFERARRELSECLELDSGSGTARLFLGLTLVEMSRHDEAIRELETASQVAASPEMSAALAYACARAGHLERARGLLGQLVLLAEQRYVSPSLIAQVHAGLGDADVAFECLQRASDVRAIDLAWLAVRPVFDELRADPRFNALVARMRQ